MSLFRRPRTYRRRALMLESLDERILMDAAAMVDGVPESLEDAQALPATTDEASVESATTTQSPPVDDTESGDTGAGEAGHAAPQALSEQEDSGSADSAQSANDTDPSSAPTDDVLSEQTVAQSDGAVDSATREEIAFVDTSVVGHEEIVRDLESKASGSGVVLRVEILDTSDDAVSRIGASLSANAPDRGFDAIHLVSHGDAGEIRLGDAVIDRDALEANRDAFASWRDSLNEGADLLIYGCDVASTAEGEALLARIGEITGADVAASTNSTGDARQGGDWTLEYASGSVETDVAVSNAFQGSYAHLLVDDPQASTSITLPSAEKLNHVVGFSVTFDNAAAPPGNIGYGPYMDVVIEAGLDADYAGAVGVPESGSGPVAFIAYDWDDIANVWVELDASGAATGNTLDPTVDFHPLDTAAGTPVLPLPTGANAGDRWYAIELPFGSFTENQPTFDVDFTAQLDAADGATLGDDLSVTSRGGFRFGTDPLDNAASDPPLFEASENTALITPELVSIVKTSDAPENETATGPNYPVEFTLTIDIAPGETINDMVIADSLPANAYYRGDLQVLVSDGAGGTVDVTAAVTGASGFDAPPVYEAAGSGGNAQAFNLPLGAVTGNDSILQGPAAAAPISEVVVTYSVFYGLEDNADAETLPGGTDQLALNESRVTGTHTTGFASAGDDGAGGEPVGNDGDGSDVEVQIEAVTIRKGVDIVNNVGGTTVGAGDTLEWTLTAEISDYYGLENIVVQDLFSDGQQFDHSFVPVLTLFAEGVAVGTFQFGSGGLSGGSAVGDQWGDTSPAPNPATSEFPPAETADVDPYYYGQVLTDGTARTELAFNVSGLLEDAVLGLGAGGGLLLGDIVNGAINGGTDEPDAPPPPDPLPDRPGRGTYFTITFRSEVLEEYRVNPAGGSGDLSIDVNDALDNNTSIQGDVVREDPDNPGVLEALPTPSADGSSAGVVVGGPTVEKTIFAINGNQSFDNALGLFPGDLVTYRLRSELPTPDVEDFVVTDYLPLPVYDVSTITQVLIDPSELSNGLQLTAGLVEYGPDHDLDDVVGLSPDPHSPGPAVTINTDENSVSINFGTFDSPATAGAVVIDLLITVEVQNEPMADDLFLTNQAQWSVANTVDTIDLQDDLVFIRLNNPNVVVTKGVVATNGDTSQPNEGFAPVPVGPSEIVFNAPGSSPSLTFTDLVTPDDLIAEPIDSDLVGVDGVDTVTFAVAAYNSGGSGAYGLEIGDSLPTSGFLLPGDIATTAATVTALNLQVYRGDNVTLVAGTDFDAAIVGGELRINFLDTANAVLDGSGDGADGEADGNGNADGEVDRGNGDEVFILTYDLVTDNDNVNNDDVVAGSSHSNTAQVDFYSGTAAGIGDADANWVVLDGDGDPVDPDLSDDATVTIAVPRVAKALISSEIDDDEAGGSPLDDGTGNDFRDEDGVNERYEGVIGERLTYQVSITVPEGETVNAVLNDTLDRGLELVSIDSIEVQDENGNARLGLVTSSIWNPNFLLFTPITDTSAPELTYNFVDDGNSSFSLDLGTLANTDGDDATDEVIVVTYTAMVTNDSSLDHGDNRNNQANVSFDVDGESRLSNNASAPNLTILEPRLRVVKTVEVDGDASGPPANEDNQSTPDRVSGDEGDPVTYTIVIEHSPQSGDPGADAFEVELLDEIPAQVTGLALVSAIRQSDSQDLAGDRIFLNGQTLETNNGADTPFDLEYGDRITVTVTGTLGGGLVVGDDILNEAGIQWTSYPGTPAGTNFVPTGDDAERTGDPADPGESNDYSDSDPSVIEVGTNEISKILINTGTTNEADATADGDLAAPDGTDGVNRGAEAVIGERVRYRVTVTLAEGETLNATFTDQLDPGLALVSIDSITLEDPNGNVSGTNLALLTALPYPLQTVPLGGLVTYTHAPGNNADELTIDFGNIDNADGDNTAAERIVIEYTAMVTDIAANQGNGAAAGTQLDNGARFEWENSNGDAQTTGTDSADAVEVIEPALEVEKSVAVDGPGDAGDAVTYTIVLRHTGTSEADAFDVSLADTLPSSLDFSGVNFGTGTNVSVTDSAAVLTSADFEISGGVLQFAATGNTDVEDGANTIDMPVARTIEISITGVIVDAVQPADVISNTASIAWSSLDEHDDGGLDLDDEDNRSGFVGVAPPDNEDRERNYGDSDAAANITVPGPSLDKTLVGTDVNSTANANDEATIGELVTYRLTVSLTEGTLVDAEIVDTLDAGLAFFDVVSVTTSAGAQVTTSNGDGTINATNITADAGSPPQVTFDLGTLTATGDNGPTPAQPDQGLDQVIIEYRVVVEDIAANVQGTGPLDNQAILSWQGNTPDQTAPVDAADIVVVEPDLDVTKVINGLADGEILQPVDAGDPVTYSITIQHTDQSGADAFDVTLSDPLPAEFDFSGVNFGTGANVTVSDSEGVLTSSDFTIVGNELRFDIDGDATPETLDIAVGRVITVSITGAVASDIGPGEIVVNNATIDWTSLPEGHANDGAANERGDPGDADDVYRDTDDARFATDVPTFAKTVSSTSIHGDGGDGELDLTIGETVSFDLVATLPEGDTPLVITDILPSLAGDGGTLALVSAEVISMGAGITSSNGLTVGSDLSHGSITGTPGGSSVIFDFGVASVPADNDDTNNVIVVRTTAVVTNTTAPEPHNTDGDTLVNTATLDFADPDGSDPDKVLTDTASVDIIEPGIDIDKVFVDPDSGDPIYTVSPGDTVRVRLTVTNTGTANAYDVIVTDAYNSDQPVFVSPSAVTVPAGFSAVPDAGGAGLGDDEIRFEASPGTFIAPSQTLVFEFDLTLSESETGAGGLVALTIDNTASVAGDSMDGDVAEERDVGDSATDVIYGRPAIDKTVLTTSVTGSEGTAPDGGAADQFDAGITDVTIGERITYQVVMTLPESDANGDGVSEQLLTRLVDDLPDGFALVDARLVSLGGNTNNGDTSGGDISNSSIAVGESLVTSAFISGSDANFPSPSGGDGEDDRVTFEFGSLVVDDTNGNDAIGERQIVVEIVARVLDIPSNTEEDGDDPSDDAANDRTNQPTLEYGSIVLDDNATVEIVEPNLAIAKNFVDPDTGLSIFNARAGDVVRIVLDVTNDGSAAAYDVDVIDDLTQLVTDGYVQSGSASVVTVASGFTDATAGDIVAFLDGTVGVGQTAQFAFDVTLSEDLSLEPSDLIENIATVDGQSLPPGDPNAGDGRDTGDADSDNLSGLPAIGKQVADSYDDGLGAGDTTASDGLTDPTSHSATGSGQFDGGLVDLTIGERVTYEVSIVLPNTHDDARTTLVPAIIEDLLPDGFGLVDARVVAIGGVTTVGAISGGEVVADTSAILPPGVTGTPSSGLAVGDSLLGGSAFISGVVGSQSVSFDFGGIGVNGSLLDESSDGPDVDEFGNVDDDLVGAEQTIVVQIDAVVLNEVVNDVPDANPKTNTSTLTWTEVPDSPVIVDATADVEVVEPIVAIEKTFLAPDSDVELYTIGAGDEARVRLVVTNTGSANAYDVVVFDEVDATRFENITELVTPPGFVFSVGDGANPALADTPTWTMDSAAAPTDPDRFLAVGESLVFEFMVTATTAFEPAYELINTANVSGDSLPGDDGNERTSVAEGDDTLYGDPGLQKTVLASANPDTGNAQHNPLLEDLNVGEEVTYSLVITLPETPDGPVRVVLVDDLPDGLAILDASVTAIGSAVSTDLSVGDSLSALSPGITAEDINFADRAPYDGPPHNGLDDRVTFDFGDVSVSDANDLGLQTITVVVTAVVTDVEPEIVDGVVAENTGTLQFFGDPVAPDEPIVVTDSASVEIVEPEVGVQKRFFDADGAAEVETVTAGDTVSIVLTLTNTGTGPAYDIEIQDPLDDTLFDIDSVTPASTPAGYVFSQLGRIVIYRGDGPLAPGDSIEFRLTVQTRADIGPDTIVNEALVTAADTVPGDSDFQRGAEGATATDTLDVRPIPVPVEPTTPGQPVPPESEVDRILRTYRYDVLDLSRGEIDELLAKVRQEIQHELPQLPISYLMTGITEHGSNVLVTVYDRAGVAIGMSSTLADPAGNWVISFPSLVLDRTPHHIEIQVTQASYNDSTVGVFNSRAYFTPAFDTRHFTAAPLDSAAVFREQASSIVDSLHRGLERPLGDPGGDWNHPHEFLATANVEKI